MKTEIIIICITIIILYGMYLYYNYYNTYVDSIIEKGTNANERGKVIGVWRLYKRVYKNGKTTYFEKNYNN